MTNHRPHFTQSHLDAYLNQHSSHDHFTQSLANFVSEDSEPANGVTITLAKLTFAINVNFPFIKGFGRAADRARQCVALAHMLVALGRYPGDDVTVVVGTAQFALALHKYVITLYNDIACYLFLATSWSLWASSTNAANFPIALLY